MVSTVSIETRRARVALPHGDPVSLVEALGDIEVTSAATVRHISCWQNWHIFIIEIMIYYTYTKYFLRV